jgi:hypothetical protein
MEALAADLGVLQTANGRDHGVSAQTSTAVTNHTTPPMRSQGSQLIVLKVCIAFAFAVLIPSPFGGWPPISLLLWGLMGDPQSGTQAIAFMFGGAGLLAAYTSILFVTITLTWRGLTAGVRRVPQLGRRAS